MLRMSYAAVNLGTLEVIGETGRFKELARRSEIALVSANASRAGAAIARPRYIVREVPAGAPDRPPLRVGFVGLTASSDTSLEVSFSDPSEAARGLLPELRKNVDLLVVLGCLRLGEARALVAQVPGIDVLVGAAGERLLAEPQVERDTLIVYPGERGMFLGELRLFFDARRHANRYFHRLVPLTKAVGEDASLLEFQREAEAEIRAAKQN